MAPTFSTPRPKINIYHILILIWLVAFSIIGLTVWYANSVLPPQFPLFFSLPSGTIEQLATIKELYYVSFALSGISTINFIMALLLIRKYRILTNILISAQIVIVIVFNLAIWQVIGLIT